MYQTGHISDIKQDVLDALQGRTDISDSTIARYVSKAARELSESYPLEGLQSTGPLVQLTMGLSSYPVKMFLNDTDIYSFPMSFAIYVDFPANTITAPIRYKTTAAIEAISAPATQGIPAWFNRFSNQFLLAPVPVQNYSVFLRYQAKHPFSPTPTIDDPLYISLSWYDILAYSAAMRIAITKRWTDQRKELHDLLFGDPEYVVSDGKRGRPGLVAARLFQVERDQMYNSRNLNIVVGRTNPR